MYCAKPRAASPRGIIETFISGSAYLENQPATACPASWCATISFSRLDITLFFFSIPPSTLSVAASKSTISTEFLPFLAAMRAPSLQMFAMSAPANPGVRDANFFATVEGSTASLIFFRWTMKIWYRPRMSGLSIRTCLSNRPGRKSALSRMSARFVPASTTTPDVAEKPSISTSRAFSVFSLSSFPPEKPPRPRARPTASISSMKTIHGA
mmetsp:Transcript_20055/g.80344  ORF Transcript_20055/g.80344 Transcript_20055/m.80344 type:complete len:211 (-) Transcript_20055:1625-2257(-)